MPNALTVPRDRSAPKRRQPVSAAVREAIITASVEGKTQVEIAEAFDRSPHTIRTVLRSEYGQTRKAELQQEMARVAVDKLRRNVDKAADSWIRQLELSMDGRRANHLPAKDLLTHLKVLDVPSPRSNEKTEITIQIGGSSDDIVADTVGAAEPEPAQPPARVTSELPDDDPTL